MRAAARIGFLLLLAACTSAAGASTAPDISTSFAAFWASAKGQPFAAQLQLWNTTIEAPRRDLYASVVWETQSHADWQARKQRFLQTRFAQYPDLAAGIPTESQTVQHTLATVGPAFRRLFPDADVHPRVAILLAPNFDAKSGVLPDNSLILVFAVDSLLLEQADLGIVVPHELFHLYHAQHAGIRNDGVMPGVALTLPLFEEGLADLCQRRTFAGTHRWRTTTAERPGRYFARTIAGDRSALSYRCAQQGHRPRASGDLQTMVQCSGGALSGGLAQSFGLLARFAGDSLLAQNVQSGANRCMVTGAG
jgi:hypothetical protein